MHPNPKHPLLIPPAASLQKYPITDVRGRGLMLAAEFGSTQPDGSLALAAPPHTAANITHAAARRGLLLMGAGGRGWQWWPLRPLWAMSSGGRNWRSIFCRHALPLPCLWPPPI